MTATHIEVLLTSGNSVHDSSENTVALKSKFRKHLNSQSIFFFFVVFLNSLGDFFQLHYVIKVYHISAIITTT